VVARDCLSRYLLTAGIPAFQVGLAVNVNSKSDIKLRCA
jgi:hypothetical protein